MSNVAKRLSTLERELREAKEEVARLTLELADEKDPAAEGSREAWDALYEEAKTENDRLAKENTEREQNLEAATVELEHARTENARLEKEREGWRDEAMARGWPALDEPNDSGCMRWGLCDTAANKDEPEAA